MAASPLSPIDVAQRHFRTVLRGYAPREVDAFLHEVSHAMTQLVQQTHQLEAELSVQRRVLDGLRGRENDVKEALVTAQQAVEQVRAGADNQAKLKLEAAQMQAAQITAEAESRMGSLLSQVGELTRQRARFIEELRGMVSTHARMLELYGPGETAAPAASAGKPPAVLEALEAPLPPAFLENLPRAARPVRRHEGRLTRQKE